MSITSRIRKSPVVVTTILLAFTAGYLLPYLSEVSKNIFSPSKTHVGTIAGYKVPYLPEYKMLYERTRQKESSRGHYEGLEGKAHHQAWRKLILQHGFKQTYDALGLAVCRGERHEMLLGYDIPAHIRMLPQFQDPTTQEFDKGRYLTSLKSYGNDSQGRAFLRAFEEELTGERRYQKLSTIITESRRTPKRMKKKEQKREKARTVRVLYIPCSSVADSQVRKSITEKDKQAYYKKHKQEFAISDEESSKTIEYVELKILADNETKQKVVKELQSLRKKFSKVKVRDAEDFAKQESDNQNEVVVEWKKSELPPNIQDSLSKRLEKEKYPALDPITQGGKVVLYKYIGLAPTGFSLVQQEPVYRFAKIERNVDPDHSNESKTLQEASKLVAAVNKNKKEWKEIAEKFGHQVQNATITLATARKVSEGTYRKLIRWVFSEAKIGQFSAPIKTKHGSYVVAVMTKEQKAGFKKPQDVDKEIEQALFNERKTALIKAKLEGIGIEDKSLGEIQNTYGAGAYLEVNKSLSFSDNAIVGNTYAPRAVGAAFGLKGEGERTMIIEDEHGVYLIERLKDSPEAKQKSMPKKQEGEISEEEAQEIKEKHNILNFILEGKVDDQRFRFYD